MQIPPMHIFCLLLPVEGKLSANTGSGKTQQSDLVRFEVVEAGHRILEDCGISSTIVEYGGVCWDLVDDCEIW